MRKIILLIIFIVSLGITIGGWWGYSGSLVTSGISSDVLLACGRLGGLLAVYAILWQVIFISRLPWFEQAVSLDRALTWHHVNGLAATVFIISHPIFLGLAYSQISQTGFWSQIIGFVFNWEDVWGALVGIILFLVAIFLSIQLIKKKYKYEVWYLFHLLIYIAIVTAFGHQLAVGGDFIAQGWFRAWWGVAYFIVFGLLIIYRFLRPVWLMIKHNFKISRVVAENNDVYSVYISGRRLDEFIFVGGQFFIIRFLMGKDWWQAHPFSVSQSYTGTEIRVTIKRLGDYTRNIKNLKPGVHVMLDGPHGAMTVDRATKDKVLLLASGIGVTPLRSLAEDLVKAGRQVTLVYANKTMTDQIFLEEFKNLDANKFKLITIVSPNHIDETLIAEVAPELKDWEVFVCGPKPMMDSVRGIVIKLNLPKGQYHWEKFSF